MPAKKKILFGGGSEIPSEEVFAEVRNGWPKGYKLLNAAVEAFRKSPANKGRIPTDASKPATIEQVWNFFTMFGVMPYCLLSTDQPDVPTGKMEKVIKLTSEQLIEALKQISINESGINTTLLFYDGITGHCILLKYYNEITDRFIYHDPWPLDSLLAGKNNAAGVNALQREDGYWSVTASELKLVIFAVFAFSCQWERMQKTLLPLLPDDLKGSDFFNFFRLVEIACYKNKDHEEIQYSPSRLKGIVVISIKINKAKRIDEAILLMNKDWIKENIMFVPDITRSFIKAFVPANDREQYKEIIDALYIDNLTKIFPVLAKEGANGDLKKEILLAYAGLTEKSEYSCEFSNLVVSNEIQNNIRALQLTISLW